VSTEEDGLLFSAVDSKRILLARFAVDLSDLVDSAVAEVQHMARLECEFAIVVLAITNKHDRQTRLAQQPKNDKH